MLKKLLEKFHDLYFGQKLILILLLFALIPLLCLQQIMMHFYEKQIITDASQSTLSVVRANNNVLSTLLDGVENTSNMMLNNEFYYDIFTRIETFSVGDCLRFDRLLSSKMAKEFSTQKEVFKACFYTSKWIFNSNTSLIPLTGEDVRRAGYDRIAREAREEPCWITGYDYGERIGSEFLQKKESYDYQYPLTMVRSMDFQLHSMNAYQKLPSDVEKPVLIVQILEKDVRKLYQDSITYGESIYMIANDQGTVVSSDNDTFPVNSLLPQPFLSCRGSGYLTCHLDNRAFLLCYDSLTDKGLTSLALVPRDVLLKSAVSAIRKIQFFSVLALIALSFGVAFGLSRTITSPIQQLISASLRVAGGDFSASTPVPKGGDFRLLTESFNHMEREIDRLIHENYEISLREKESQLAALSMQINPHFLYNTLNTINLLAIQNNDEEISDLIVDLSEMLQYTFRSFAEKTLLCDEIGWVSNYLHIMSKRYDNLFCTRMDIDENLEDALVPKLILQPLVENAILHGFRQTKKDGLLTILISGQEDKILFIIKDNGCGMTCTQPDQGSGHVGLSNVHRRLSLLYGENYTFEISSAPGEGTCVRIRIPLELQETS